MGILRPRQVQPKFPEIGRIYKGSPKGTSTGKGAYKGGDDLDHFRFEASNTTKDLPATDGSDRTLYEQLKDNWLKLGEAPRSIPIRLLHSSPESNFSYSNEVWGKDGSGKERCLVRCNGAIMSQYPIERKDPATGRTRKVVIKGANNCQAVEGAKRCPMGCKPTARLSLVIPSLGYPGVVLFVTHSIYDIEEIKGNLEAYRQFDLSGIPFRLERSLKPCDWNKEDGSVLQQKKWLCHVAIDPQYGLMALQAAEQRAYAALSGGESQPSRSLPAAPMPEYEAEVLENEPESDPAPITTMALDLLQRADSDELRLKAIGWVSAKKQRSAIEAEGGWEVVSEAIARVQQQITPQVDPPAEKSAEKTIEATSSEVPAAAEAAEVF